ncbi:MAG: HD domain-containing protein [Patescibacteria group bacterium]|jgi:HD superfamily phosphodiesterase
MESREQQLIDIAKPYLDSARSGDWEHALRVVRWVKELGAGRSDLHLLTAAAYIHDIGWSGIAPKGKIDFDEMLKLEPQAAENSSRLVTRILHNLEYDDSDILVINRLIAAADKHESEKDDEEIIVDSDNLSKLCIEHLNEKYQPESFSKLFRRWDDELDGRIKTTKGREIYPKILEKLKKEASSYHK